MAAVAIYKLCLSECRDYVSRKLGYVYILVEREGMNSSYVVEFDKDQYENGGKLYVLLKKSEIGQFKNIEIVPCDGAFMLENGFMTHGDDLFYKCDNLEAVTRYVGYMHGYNCLTVTYYKDGQLEDTKFFQLGDVIISELEYYDEIGIECVFREPDTVDSSVEGVDVWW